MDEIESQQLSHDLCYWCIPFPLCRAALRAVRSGMRPHDILVSLVPPGVLPGRAVSRQQYVLLARYLGRANAHQIMMGREP